MVQQIWNASELKETIEDDIIGLPAKDPLHKDDSMILCPFLHAAAGRVFRRCKCRNGSGVPHIDSTGTVMKRMPEQKVPYYYAMVTQDHSMPVCEFLTICHRHAWLMSVMDHFLSDVATVNAGR